MTMLVRVKLIGAGKPGDPYRVNLPDYRHVHGNVTQGYAIVLVSDEVHGLTEDDLAHETVEETTEGPLYPELCAACTKKVHKHFDTRYQEHKGKFRLEKA